MKRVPCQPHVTRKNSKQSVIESRGRDGCNVPNIRDIARLSGVSPATVSRVLNNHPYVKDDVRAAVWRVVEQTNYRKNMNAVHLSTGKTLLIGVILPFAQHPYFSLLLEGIAHEAFIHNYHLVLFQTNYEEKRELEALEMLKNKLVDGLIVCSRCCEESVLTPYTEFGPIVLCEDTRGTQLSSVSVDHFGAFAEALDYLYHHGHRRIGYCVGRRTGSNSLQRERAYRDFLQRIDEPFQEDFVFEQCLYIEDGERIMNEILRMTTPPTALLVTSDHVAAGVLIAARVHRIAIPGRLAVVGFDNQSIAKIMDITTIEIPLLDIGQRLFQTVLNSEKEPIQVQLPFRLIERHSV